MHSAVNWSAGEGIITASTRLIAPTTAGPTMKRREPALRAARRGSPPRAAPTTSQGLILGRPLTASLPPKPLPIVGSPYLTPYSALRQPTTSPPPTLTPHSPLPPP